MTEAMKRSYATFERMREELVAQPDVEGQFAVVFEDRLLGVRPDIHAALTLGYEEARSNDFVAERISREPRVVIVPIVLWSAS